MTPEHASALELVRELRRDGASYVRVDGVEVKFDLLALPLTPVPFSDDREEELIELRNFKRRAEELGLAR
jgi:hypothetical protein